MSIPALSSENLPITYQKEDMDYIFKKALACGESCALAGVGSAGKSNLLKVMLRSDVIKHYLGDSAQHYVVALLNPHHMIYLQGNSISETGESWPGYELALSRLRQSLARLHSECSSTEDREMLKALVLKVRESYSNLFGPQPLLIQAGVRHLEEAVYDVLRTGPDWRIVFLLDEVEELFARLPAEFFQSLRGIRDEFKRRVMFVTASRRLPDELVQELAASKADARYEKVMEGFVELFHGFSCYIGLLDYESFRYTVHAYLDHHNMTTLSLEAEDRLVRRLYEATDGHAGLLRRSFLPAVKKLSRPGDEFLDYLLQDQGVNRECRIILASLPSEERQLLEKAATGQPVSDSVADVWETLCLKHLLGSVEGGGPFIRPPILRRFLTRERQ